MRADGDVERLIGSCGAKDVGDAYRAALSGCATEAQVAELVCELMVAASLGTRTQAMTLRPATGRGKTRSDFATNVAGVRFWGEVKRFDDRYFYENDGDVPRMRSLARTPAGEPVPAETARPRTMDLASKLDRVPAQFPDSRATVLFVFDDSFGDSDRYLQGALFGDAAQWVAIDALPVPVAPALFAREAWRVVSACCLAHWVPEYGFCIAPWWSNPGAAVPLPREVRELLASVSPPSA
jgi:hypothetical protein